MCCRGCPKGAYKRVMGHPYRKGDESMSKETVTRKTVPREGNRGESCSIWRSEYWKVAQEHPKEHRGQTYQDWMSDDRLFWRCPKTAVSLGYKRQVAGAIDQNNHEDTRSPGLPPGATGEWDRGGNERRCQPWGLPLVKRWGSSSKCSPRLAPLSGSLNNWETVFSKEQFL